MLHMLVMSTMTVGIVSCSDRYATVMCSVKRKAIQEDKREESLFHSVKYRVLLVY